MQPGSTSANIQYDIKPIDDGYRASFAASVWDTFELSG